MIPALVLSFINRLPAVIVGPVVAAVVLFGAHQWNQWIHDPMVRHEALKGYVAQSKLDAAQSQLDEVTRQKSEGDLALESLKTQLAAQDIETKDLQSKLEEQVTAYENRIDKMDGNCRPILTEPDYLWLLKP